MNNKYFRENNYVKWLESFKKQWGITIKSSDDLHISYPTIEYIDTEQKLAKRLINWYEEILEAKVRRKLKVKVNGKIPRVDRYKVISGTELCIIHLLPIKHDNYDTRRILNAYLAVYIGNSILADWEKIKVSKVSPTFRKIEKKHFLWLANFDPSTNYPVIRNSLFWDSKSDHLRLYARILRLRKQRKLIRKILYYAKLKGTILSKNIAYKKR